jgi:hypothetical protein
MKRAVSWTFFASTIAVLGLTGVMACSNQGEGERCDPDNKNEDCASGLTCQKIQGQESPLCCPPPPNPATVSACIPGQLLQPDSGPGSDAAPDVKSDVSEDVTEDVQEEASTETGPDASEEASTEGGPDASEEEAGPEAGPDAPEDAAEDVEQDAEEDAG